MRGLPSVESGPDRVQDSVRDEIEVRVEHLRGVLRGHAGGIDLVNVFDDGTVQVRFSGMCSGCPLKPLTMERLVRPELMGIGGVVGVEADGCRISSEARERLMLFFLPGSEVIR